MSSTFPLFWITIVFLLLVWLVAMVCGKRAAMTGSAESPLQRQVGQILRALALITVIGSLASALNLFGLTVLVSGLLACVLLEHSWHIRRILSDFASVFEIWERVRNPDVWHRIRVRFWAWLKNQGSTWHQSILSPTILVWSGVAGLMAATFFFAKGQFAISNLRLLQAESYALLLQSKYTLFNTVTPDRIGNGLAVLTATVSLLSATDALHVVRMLGPIIACWLAGATGYLVFWATGQKLAGIVTGCLVLTGILSGPIPGPWLQPTWPPEPAAAFGLKLLTTCNEAVGRSLAGLPFEAALAVALCTWPALAASETPDQLWDGLAGISLTTLLHPGMAVGLLLAALFFHIGVILVSRLALPMKQLFFGALAWGLAVGIGHGLILLQSHAQMRSKALFSWLVPSPQTVPRVLPPVHWTGAGIIEALRTAPFFVFLAGVALVTALLLVVMVFSRSGSGRTRLLSAGWLVFVWTGLVCWSGIDPLQPVPPVFQEILQGWPWIVICWIGLGVGALMNWIEAAFPRLTQVSLFTAFATLAVCGALVGASLWRGNLPPFQAQDQTLRFWCGDFAQAGGLSLLEYDQSARIIQQITRHYPRGEWMVIAPTEQFIEVFGRGWHIDLFAWSQQFTQDQVQSPEFRFPIELPDTFIFIEKRPWISDPRPQPSVVGFAQQTDITFRMYRNPAGRSSLMQSTLNLLNAYGTHHTNLGVFFEDDHLVVFHLINQNSTRSLPFRLIRNWHETGGPERSPTMTKPMGCFSLGLIFLMWSTLSCAATSPPVQLTARQQLKQIRNYVLYYGSGRVTDLRRFETIVIEPRNYTATQVTALKAPVNGKRPLLVGYLTCAEVLPNDPILKQAFPQDYYRVNGVPVRIPGSNAYLMDLRQSHWRTLLINQMQKLISSGYDGVFLDTLNIGDEPPYAGTPTGEGFLQSAGFLTRDMRTRYPNNLILQNWGINRLKTFTAGYLDAICWENFQVQYIETDAWSQARLAELTALQGGGLSVMTLYQLTSAQITDTAYQSRMYQVSRSYNFLPYCALPGYSSGVNLLPLQNGF
ncbi:MAG TPA: hypothetical protein PLB32_08390 [Acidobacteriota bacterium]|nr:hypothetical protein [Acidobacteriota bacterium]